MNAKRALSLSNAKIILNQPSTLIAFVRGGKIEAFSEILKNLFKKLGELSTNELTTLMEECKKDSKAVLPKAGFYQSGSEFTNTLMLYYLIRLEKPQTVIETGVWTGKTSWTILQALADNGSGRLISIDLGEKVSCTSKLPVKEIGGLVPDHLRSLWTLHIGDSMKLLPSILAEQKNNIDMFYHDSNHTYEHMTFEFTTAYRHLKNNGIICSDDIDANDAWKDFTSKLSSHYEIDAIFGFGHK